MLTHVFVTFFFHCCNFFIFFRHIFASTLVVEVCNVQNILQNRKYLFVFLTHFMYSKLLSQMPSFHIKGFFLVIYWLFYWKCGHSLCRPVAVLWSVCHCFFFVFHIWIPFWIQLSLNEIERFFVKREQPVFLDPPLEVILINLFQNKCLILLIGPAIQFVQRGCA